jgi:hypothetical protein
MLMSDLSEKEWLARKEAANFLTLIGCPISAGRLANMASNNNAGRGPAFTRIGWKSVRYQPKDLRAWAKARSKRIE